MESNLALITTLYNTPGADFYKDIYFPIIRYSVLCIYNEFEEKEKHYDVTALRDKIKEKTGIPIPLHVLKTSICAIAQKGIDSGIQVYERGNYFKITPEIAYGFHDVESNADVISRQYRRVELFLLEFLESEGLTSTKTIKDFLQSNSNEVLEYINNNDAEPVIDQEYVNVVRFIDWVKITKPEYYRVVENLLWGAIVAGFLQRSNPDLGIKTVENVDYYLDSSLVLSLLGLNSYESVEYAKELKHIIAGSGSTVKVHAITIREVKRILEQVELSQGPRRGSSIEQAWAQRDLNLSDILQIRNRLETLLMNEKISMVPMSDSQLDQIEQKYKSNYDVKLLAEQRGSKNEDLIREIHDIYMRDTVRELNQEGTVIEKQRAYFVSLNSDLVKFSNRGQAMSISVIHAAKVVMNLWLHNVSNTGIKQNALAEVMSRCYAQNQTDVRIKLRVFFKYYRDCSLTQEDVESMYSSIIHRSANTLAAVEALIENEENGPENKADISKEIINGLKVAVAKEKAEREAKNVATQSRIQSLIARTEVLEQAINKGEEEAGTKDLLIKQYEDSLSLSKTSIERLERELENERELRQIEAELHGLFDQKKELSRHRDKSVRYIKFWLVLVLEIIALVVLVGCTILAVVSWDKEHIINKFTIASAISFLVLVTRITNMYLFSPQVTRMRIRDEQYHFWDDKHPEYNSLIERIRTLELKKRELEGV